MLDQNADPRKSLRVCKKYGDEEIILNIFSTQFWKDLFLNKEHVGWVILAEFVKLNRYMLALSIGTFFRYKYGTRTNGFIITLLTTFMLLSWNCASVFILVKPLLELGMPLLPFFMDWQSIKTMLVDNVHSKSMFVYTIVFFAIGLFHACTIAFGYGEANDRTKRGRSYLYELLFKKTSVGEYTIQGIIEPTIAALVGWLLWDVSGDYWFAVYLWLAALSQALIETMDHANMRKFYHAQ
jgi:hypothetical protein